MHTGLSSQINGHGCQDKLPAFAVPTGAQGLLEGACRQK